MDSNINKRIWFSSLQSLKQLTLLTKNGLITSLASYLLTITLANFLGPEVFGQYSYILIIGSIASVVVAFSTDSTSPVLFASGQSKSTVFNAVYSVRVLMLTLVVTILLGLSLTEPVTALGICAIAVASMNLGFVYEMAGINVRYSYVYMAERTAYVITIFSLIYFEAANLVLVLSFLLIFTLLSCLWQLCYHKDLVSKFEFGLKKVKKVLKANVSLILISLSTFAYGGFSRLVLEGKFGMVELGVYSAGWQIVMAITLFQAQADRVWRVKITTALLNRAGENLRDHLRAYILLTSIPVAMFAFLVYTYTPELVTLIFGEDYLLLLKLLPIFCVYFLVVNLDSLVVMCWIGVGNRFEYLLVSVSIGITLIVSLLLLPPGTTLPVFASLVVAAHGLSALLLLIRFYFKYISPWKNFNSRKDLQK